jgi:hypothetical protein
MAAYASDVFDSTQSQEEKQKKLLDRYETRMMAGQKQFGGKGTAAQGLSSSGRQAAEEQIRLGEATRRPEATEKAYQLGSTIDKRKSQLSDEVEAALRKRQNLTTDAATKQSQQDRENALSTEQITEGAKSSMRDLNFSLYKSQTERDQAMREAWQKGSLESELQVAAINNSLRMQDVENYYKLLIGDLQGEMQKFEAMSKFELEDWTNSMMDRAKNWGALITSLETGIKAAPQVAATGVEKGWW